MSARAWRSLALCAVAAGLAAAGTIAIPAAHTAENQRHKPPTLLWKSYPLEQRSHQRAVTQGVARTREASVRTAPAPRSRLQLESLLLASVLAAMLLAIATIVLLRSSVPVRVGSSLRSRARPPSPRPAHRPKPRKTARERMKRPPLREVTAEIVTEPETPSADVAERQPELELLEVVQPEPETRLRPAAETRPSAREPDTTPEQALELQLLELTKRRRAAPASARSELEREIEALHERIETRRAETPEPEAGTPLSLARCEIRLWRGFMKCQLYASLGGSAEAFALSPYFRLRDHLEPNEQAQQALATLVAELEQGGWAVVSGGRPWYRHTLELLPPDREHHLTGGRGPTASGQ
jgi:hypothetical protein